MRFTIDSYTMKESLFVENEAGVDHDCIEAWFSCLRFQN